MKQEFLIAGNWKMNTDLSEAQILSELILNRISNINLSDHVKILLCPPFINLERVNSIINKSVVSLGAQNCFYEPRGAYTGEISIDMLKSAGCEFIIIGHSERRKYFHETDSIINLKTTSVLNAGLKAIVCIGETLEERNQNRVTEVLERQLRVGLNNISQNLSKNLIVAYEPVWAIGTGIAATSEQIAEAHLFIKNILKDIFPGTNILVLYGGSVDSSNSRQILSLNHVDGALIGGASLKADIFAEIISVANEIISIMN